MGANEAIGAGYQDVAIIPHDLSVSFLRILICAEFIHATALRVKSLHRSDFYVGPPYLAKPELGMAGVGRDLGESGDRFCRYPDLNSSTQKVEQ